MINPQVALSSVVSELEGVLLKDADPFSYFMLIAFEASGLIRFALLLLFWPVIRLVSALDPGDAGLKLTIFIATAGLRVSDIESVARAVLPKFYYDDVNMEAWKLFSRYEKRVVVTKMPRVMVEWFAKEHLIADEVIGSELVVSRFGFVTGFVEKNDAGGFITKDRVARLFGDEKPCLGMGMGMGMGSEASADGGSSFLSLCKEECRPPFSSTTTTTYPYQSADDHQLMTNRPIPVIFHDGRLVKRPTPFTSLIILSWIPLGIILAIIRILIGLVVPMWAIPHISAIFGGQIIVKGKPPPPPSSDTDSSSNPGVLFVCTHRTLMDPIILCHALNRRIPAVTYSISRLSEIISPIPTIRLTRNRQLDADRIKSELKRGDLVLCPEGTTCREPFLLRFSALFAELTDQIVPVAMNYRVGFFHATTARGWKGLDPFFYFMNPRPVYEVTFLNQLPVEATCSSGKSPKDVANYVQRLLAATLGFECTNFTRKDKYKLLAGNDGTVKTTTNACGSTRGRGWVMLGRKLVSTRIQAFHSLKST